ncbi:MAG: hypothetical protein Q9N34_00015 [Aquificota bacterium]|nr:hypothetical protein [Aquificota bacterium]
MGKGLDGVVEAEVRKEQDGGGKPASVRPPADVKPELQVVYKTRQGTAARSTKRTGSCGYTLKGEEAPQTYRGSSEAGSPS